MSPAYDQIGRSYAGTRRTDSRIAARIEAALGEARTVANVGAGTGSYEPADRQVSAFEPSLTMIGQRPEGAAPVVQAAAEEIPAADGSFDAAMAILTIHHWSDQHRGVAEMRRIARGPIVILTFEPGYMQHWWVNYYAPEITADDRRRFPSTAAVEAWLGGARTEIVEIPRDCEDLFLGALWGRPELILEPAVRASTSGFPRMGASDEARAVERLADDLESGEWDRRYGELRALEAYDVGVRLVVSTG